MTTIQEIQSKKKGAIYKVIISGDSNFLKKGKESNLTKETTMCVRLGIKRANIKKVIEQEIENPTDQPRQLPWGEWKISNLIITHKEQDYVRCYKVNNFGHPKTIYKLDGQVVSREWLIENKYISSSEKTYSEIGDLTIKLTNLTFA